MYATLSFIAMNDWPGFSDPTPLQNSGAGIWNSPQYWLPSEAMTSESSTWGTTATAPSWTSWWGNQANNHQSTANITTPTSLQVKPPDHLKARWCLENFCPKGEKREGGNF